MKLSKEQIIHIRDFISSRGFTYYDLQLEIIDHVACRVEELMTADENLSLDEAINKTHREFGVMGFSAFEDAMRTSLKLKHWSLLREAFANFLTLKTFPFIILFVALFYRVSVAINNPDLLVNVVKVITLCVLVVYIVLAYTRKDASKQLLGAQLRNTYVVVLNVPLQIFNVLSVFLHKEFNLGAGTTGIILAVLLSATVIGLLALAKVTRITKQQARELEKQYMLTVG